MENRFKLVTASDANDAEKLGDGLSELLEQSVIHSFGQLNVNIKSNRHDEVHRPLKELTLVFCSPYINSAGAHPLMKQWYSLSPY